MEYKHTFGLFEWGIIACFILAYVIYVIRIALISRQIDQSFFLLFLKLFLRLIYSGLIVYCLLIPYQPDPSKKTEKKTGKAISRDIYIALDASLSMKANDIAPSRFVKAKEAIEQMTNELSGENLGLIIFPPGELLSPLTKDKRYFQTLLNSIEEPFNLGTDFHPPLEKALELHQLKQNTQKEAQIVVLVSDGEDFGDDTRKIVNKMKDLGITVFMLGIGTNRGGKIPEGGSYKKDRNGQFVHTKLNSAAMKKLTKLTGGEYFEVSASNNQVPELVAQIKSIEGQERESDDINDPKSLQYFYFLLTALILALLDITFSVRLFKL